MWGFASVVLRKPRIQITLILQGRALVTQRQSSSLRTFEFSKLFCFLLSSDKTHPSLFNGGKKVQK
jgi:hypothetical protein